jgi:adenine-specific DNA-methyltransferase
LELLRAALNAAMGKTWEEWEIPRAAEGLWPAEPLRFFNALQGEQAKGANASPAKIDDALRGIINALKRDYGIETLPDRPVDPWSEPAAGLHAEWWKARIARQTEIDASIAAKADSEYLYDKPYIDKKTVRVSGPFTVESLSPHRVLGVDENDELIDPADGVATPDAGYGDKPTFSQMILDNLKVAGVQQAHKGDKITFTWLTAWPGEYVCAEGRYLEGAQESGTEKRAAILIGPEFGTVTRPDLVSAAARPATPISTS